MSLNSLARRHADNRSIRGPAHAPGGGQPPGPPPAGEKGDVFEALSRYLPAETITLFLAGIAAVATMTHPPERLGLWLYAGFAVLTPVMYLALAYAKQREAERATGQPPAPFTPHPWPPTAATIAFLVWALSIKGVLPEAWMTAWGELVGLAAIVVSGLLALADRVFGLDAPA
ncbi:hypothetical protein [Caulobacter sp.]|uniref:hypothetical protein n=1 Tax=Caulobacter sp. TaxID=78 RepID=UPI002B45A2F0|nr:hypothetical protein [Caulobacter sp.]HJV42573.1 hypothetical protein [Caulobacter sp.]